MNACFRVQTFFAAGFCGACRIRSDSGSNTLSNLAGAIALHRAKKTGRNDLAKEKGKTHCAIAAVLNSGKILFFRPALNLMLDAL
jgi:hypothetical protein